VSAIYVLTVASWRASALRVIRCRIRRSLTQTSVWSLANLIDFINVGGVEHSTLTLFTLLYPELTDYIQCTEDQLSEV
jgi:hypothetical protein